jgi:hypothetical protein
MRLLLPYPQISRACCIHFVWREVREGPPRVLHSPTICRGTVGHGGGVVCWRRGRITTTPEGKTKEAAPPPNDGADLKSNLRHCQLGVCLFFEHPPLLKTLRCRNRIITFCTGRQLLHSAPMEQQLFALALDLTDCPRLQIARTREQQYRTPSGAPPCRASDRIPRELASVTEPSPRVPVSA